MSAPPSTEERKVRFVIEVPQFKRQETDLSKFLAQGLEQLKLEMTPANRQKILDYIELMIKWNRAYNLTSVREPSEIMMRHIFDSLAAGAHLHGNQIADVGTGAGLPAIPLALAYPDKEFMLIDSNGKKARFLFHVPMQGSLLLLIILTLPFIFANLLVGITFSTIANTQLQASQMAIFFFLPSIMLSGFIFPREAMPLPIYTIGFFIPLTYYLKIVRGIILKGLGYADLVPEILSLLVIGTVILTFSIRRFHKRLG